MLCAIMCHVFFVLEMYDQLADMKTNQPVQNRLAIGAEINLPAVEAFYQYLNGLSIAERKQSNIFGVAPDQVGVDLH